MVQRLAERGGDALACELDVLDEGSIARAVDRVGATYGRLEGLVNGAGVMRRGAAGDVDIGGWRVGIGTNLLGPMLVTHAAFALLTARPGADIVNVSSTSSRNPSAGSAPYGAAKAGSTPSASRCARSWHRTASG